MERTDEQILPAVYRWIGAAFHATPSQLGNLTFCRAVVQAVASPLGGFAGASQTLSLQILFRLPLMCRQ